jgi:hypothetical protein
MQALTGQHRISPSFFTFNSMNRSTTILILILITLHQLRKWVGVATHVGDELTYNILTQKQRVIYRSAIWSDMYPAKRNQRLSPLGGETVSNSLGDNILTRSETDLFESSAEDGTVLDGDPSVQRRMVTIDPQDLIGRTFLKDSVEDDQSFRA